MDRVGLRSAAVNAVVLATMFGVAAPCAAASLNVLGAFFVIGPGTGTTLFEQNLLFAAPRFDPSLGTLDSMLLTVIRGAVNASITVDSESPFFAAVFQDDVTAVAFTNVSYAGGTLTSTQLGANIGPSPGIFLPPDSDGVPDFVGSDALTFSGPIPVATIDQMISDPSTLTDFTGLGSVLLTLTISELAGSTIPGIQAIQAAYGQGIGAIGLSYEYTPAGPAPIAEPGAFALLGSSCAAFVVRAVRRRQLR
jgi:hypothetical protein